MATSKKTRKVAIKAKMPVAVDASSPEPTAAQKAAVNAAVKAVVEAPTADPVVSEGPQLVESGPMMRKKELIDLVVERSGVKKKDAKPVIEATLAILGEGLAEHRELNLLPLGKIKVRREKVMPNGRVMVTKIRQSHPNDNATDGPETAKSEAAA